MTTEEEAESAATWGGEDEAEQVDELRQDQRIFNRFYGTVLLANGATLGISNAHDSILTSRRMTGGITNAEITSAQRCYVAPVLYDKALENLGVNHVIVLYGERGTGRRTSALNMLRAVASKSLVALSPGEPLDKIATAHVYREDNGYLLCGMSDKDAAVETTDFTISQLVQNVQEAEAWLVIISDVPLGDHRSTLLPQFRWERPGTEVVLTAHGVAEEPAKHAAVRLGESVSLSDVVQLAGHLTNGLVLEEALGRTGLGATEQVIKWLEDENRTDEELLEATALLFLDGMPEHRFETHVARLLAHIPVPERQGVAGTEDPRLTRRFLDGRRPFRGPFSLIKTEQRITDMDMGVPGPPRRCLTFRSSLLRERMTAELSTQFGDRFWEPVFNWLQETVRIVDAETRMQIAWGLAMLASNDHFDAVRERFLQPWSEGTQGPRAWATVPQVVWCMSVKESATTMALRTVIRWARSGNQARRKAACRAFAGEVGIRYPADAARWLWHLVITEPDPAEAKKSLGELYALLVETAPGDARTILVDLRRRLAHRLTADKRDRYLDVLLLIMKIPGVTNEKIAAVKHLLARVEDVSAFAGLWVMALSHRPKRSAMFEALYDLLYAVSAASPKPGEHLKLIGDVLHEALPEPEREPFHLGFKRYVIRRRAGDEAGRLLLAVLLEIFRPPMSITTKEYQ